MNIERIVHLFNVMVAQKGIEFSINFLIDNNDVAKVLIEEYQRRPNALSRAAQCAVNTFDTGLFMKLYC